MILYPDLEVRHHAVTGVTRMEAEVEVGVEIEACRRSPAAQRLVVTSSLASLRGNLASLHGTLC